MEPTAVVIAGPTCTGKSSAAVSLSLRIGGEIVSADSMQVYRGMDIGTAKITREEMRGVPHHMIDVADPADGMDVMVFRSAALESIDDIFSRGMVPIIVGGTGFYIESLLFEPPEGDEGVDKGYRQRLKDEWERYGPEYMYERLRAGDPAYAQTVHPNNRFRVIRALEYIHATGRPYSSYVSGASGKTRFSFRCFVLDDDRRQLYSRIDSRVDSMIAAGFEDEVRRLMDAGLNRDSVAMQGIGYREMFDYLSGDVSLQDAVAAIKNGTRHIAKRQITWFRHRQYSEWIDVSQFGRDPERIADEIVRRLTK